MQQGGLREVAIADVAHGLPSDHPLPLHFFCMHFTRNGRAPATASPPPSSLSQDCEIGKIQTPSISALRPLRRRKSVIRSAGRSLLVYES